MSITTSTPIPARVATQTHKGTVMRPVFPAAVPVRRVATAMNAGTWLPDSGNEGWYP
jgi:hypothetical protein